MKGLTIAAVAAFLIAGAVILYLASVGVSQNIQGISNATRVSFSSAETAGKAASISTVIPIGTDGTVQLTGIRGARALRPTNEVSFVVYSRWRFRWRLFGVNRWGACSASELNRLVRDELVRLTGDDALQIGQILGVDVYPD